MAEAMTAAVPCPLLIASKSVWHPVVRREHAFATLAARAGHPVLFSERPTNVRDALDPTRRDGYLRRLKHPEITPTEFPSTRRMARAVLVPGHHDQLSAHFTNALLRAGLAGAVDPQTCVVSYLPWEWPAIAALKVARRSFDIADDWAAQVPGGERRLARYYRQIAEQADAIVVANPELADLFEGRDVTVVPNGVFDEYIGGDSRDRRPRSLVYIGTLTERFDSDLVIGVLKSLPDWELDIVGGCLYGGHGIQPAPDLERLLALTPRVRWHGPLERDQAIAIADRASVALVPNRAEFSRGQDSMKLYDYAARGLPIVASHLPGATTDLPPGTILATYIDRFAEAVVVGAAQPPILDIARRQWARTHSWSARWPAWSGAVFGDC